MHCTVVSGVTGHLGQEIARQLVSCGVEVWGLTRQDVPPDQSWRDGVRFHHIDGRAETLIGLFEEIRPDTVLHLAGLYRREHRSADIEPLIDANIIFGTQLLEAMRLTRCDRLVTAGSYFQHFDSCDYRALNLYAATKQAFEDLVAYYVDAFDISAVRLTLADIYSEHDTRPKLMTNIATAWTEAVAIQLQDEEAWIDPIHVEDAAAAFLQAATMLEDGAVPRGALSRYSVTYGRDVTASELLAIFERLGGRKLAVCRGQGWHLSRRMKPWRGDVVPGWAPRVTIEDGVARILARRRQYLLERGLREA
jgi:nucleoside-diphosphate-sugar epimerase